MQYHTHLTGKQQRRIDLQEIKDLEAILLGARAPRLLKEMARQIMFVKLAAYGMSLM